MKHRVISGTMKYGILSIPASRSPDLPLPVVHLGYQTEGHDNTGGYDTQNGRDFKALGRSLGILRDKRTGST